MTQLSDCTVKSALNFNLSGRFCDNVVFVILKWSNIDDLQVINTKIRYSWVEVKNVLFVCLQLTLLWRAFLATVLHFVFSFKKNAMPVLFSTNISLYTGYPADFFLMSGNIKNIPLITFGFISLIRTSLFEPRLNK